MLTESSSKGDVDFALAEHGLPHRMVDSVYGYLVHHAEPGPFLRNILQDDFVTAIRHADDTNRHLITEWSEFCINELPAYCWGNPEDVQSWINRESE